MSQMTRDDQTGAIQWEHDLTGMVTACLDASTADEMLVLRKVYSLMASAPDRCSALIDTLPLHNNFEAMLASGSPESAAVSLIPAHAGYMLSRGANGRCMGSVFMPGLQDEHTAEASTAALALLSAALSALHRQTHDGRRCPGSDSLN